MYEYNYSMYSEDRFHPTNNDDTYLKDLIERHIKPSKSCVDKRMTEITVSSSVSLSRKNVKVKCFGSSGRGGLIIDAVTGEPFSGHIEGDKVIRHVIGSKYEDLYFKTGDGENLFFYHSPEEFEKHQHTELSDSIKKKWREKYTLMQSVITKKCNV